MKFLYASKVRDTGRQQIALLLSSYKDVPQAWTTVVLGYNIWVYDMALSYLTYDRALHTGLLRITPTNWPPEVFLLQGLLNTKLTSDATLRLVALPTISLYMQRWAQVPLLWLITISFNRWGCNLDFRGAITVLKESTCEFAATICERWTWEPSNFLG